MVTTVTGTREQRVETEKRTGLGGERPRGGNGSRGPNGKGPGGGGGGEKDRPDWSPEKYRIGLLAGLASILMMFTALTSAYIVRSGLPTSTDWQPITMPRVLIVSTALILLSSLTVRLAQRAAREAEENAHRRWLAVTLALGLAFLASQLLAWRMLAAQGVFLASNPHSSFFYLLTGLHALHLAGGILALGYVLMRTLVRDERASAAARRRVATEAVALYWHFMDALWVFLFLLLFVWR